MDVSPGDGGKVKVNQELYTSYPATISFPNGTSVLLEVVPAEGYRFVEWSGSLSDKKNPANVTIDCDKKVTAIFSRIVIHNVNINANGSGSTTPAIGNHSYEKGTKISIKAVPEKGWQFAGWTGDVIKPDMAATDVIVGSNMTIKANFSRIMHTLTLIANGNGITTPPMGEHSYGEGVTVKITAAPDEGWLFDGWTGDVAEYDMTTTEVLIDYDKTVEANFAPIIQEEKTKANWLLIGVITGALIIGGAVVLILRSRTG